MFLVNFVVHKYFHNFQVEKSKYIRYFNHEITLTLLWFIWLIKTVDSDKVCENRPSDVKVCQCWKEYIICANRLFEVITVATLQSDS
jgi:hypothetical protein